MGRSAKSILIDINLLDYVKEDLEIMKRKLSRNQCSIVMADSGLFYLFNNGKMTMFVDGQVLLPMSKVKLNDKSLIEVNQLFFSKYF
jgi:hypothetical protein